MAEKNPFWRVKYESANADGKVRAASLVLSAIDAEGAKKKANDILVFETAWFKIGKITPA